MPFATRLICVVIAGVAAATSVASAQSIDASSLAVTSPSLQVAAPAGAPKGQVQIIARLVDAPLAVAMGPNAKKNGTMWPAAQQRAYVAALKAKQDAVMASIAALGGRELARVSLAHNAIVAQIDASRLPAVAKIAGVAKVRPVVDYELALSHTVPYIGAKALQQIGVTGRGVRVAVLDSGIDYTHYNLGGPGTQTAYENAWGTSRTDPQNKVVTASTGFPSAKVVGGYDFVGEDWPTYGPLAPDPNPVGAPISAQTDGTHGTHVADIIAGRSNDGLHVGVAPDAVLYAVKVCSAVATSCSGIALLEGIDFALDPNGDNDISDAVDVVNMSLGSNYGQREDDLSEASANASRFGVVVVAAAGNAGDLPYIVSSPSTTPEVISVAQTAVPEANGYPLVINSPANIAGTYTNTATVDWAPVVGTVTQNVVYVGRGCPADALLANPSGKIALIDRGSCAVSLKVDKAANAGAVGVLIGLVAPGDPISFSYGGGSNFVSTLVITQAASNTIKANIAAPVNATISVNNAISLAGSMASTSARGPGYSYNSIKPEIGAPGASISAVAGTGTGEAAFGGTSGATPMIAGSAALLLQATPALTPSEVKAKLMNSAETNIYTNPLTSPGLLTPITRIGAGEVRVDKANALTSAAWDGTDPTSATLAFGYNALTGINMLARKVTVRNYAANARTFTVATSFRYAADQSSGAVTFTVPPSINVPANGTATFNVIAKIDASKLPAWALNVGSGGGSGATLTAMEFDGYLTMSDGTDSIHLPWHVLPHKADNVKATPTALALNGAATGGLTLTNPGGAVSAGVDAFWLTGTSARIPSAQLPQPGDNFAIIDLKSVGVRPVTAGGQPAVQFAINTWGSRAHAVYPAEFDVYLWTNPNSPNPTYVIYNVENGGFGATGQTVVTVVNLATNAAVTRFYADGSMDSGNLILTALLSDLGITSASQFMFGVYAFDNYFTGALTDAIENMTVTLNAPRYYVTGLPATIAPNATVPVVVNHDAGGDAASPGQSGMLLMYRDAKPGVEADAVSVTP